MIQREIILETQSYTADAIQRAAYRFSDRLSLDLVSEPQILRCVVHIASGDEEEADQIVGEFRNEILDQVLRARIRQETEGTRNLVLALAFSRTVLVEQDQN